jgi:hypothetical protein
VEKLTPEVIWYLFLFLMPGFLVAFWVNLLVPLRPNTDNKNIITYLLLSLVVYLPVLLFLGWKGKLPYLQSFRQMVWLLGLFLVLIPFLLGWGLSKVVHGRKLWGWTERILKVKAVHPVASAWDRAFQRDDNPWVLVTLKDGRLVGGRWDDGAVASSDQVERDLFLREVYEVPPSGEWKSIGSSLGMLIKADQIGLIEFIRPNEE